MGDKKKDPLAEFDRLSMGLQDLLIPVFTSGTLMFLCYYIGSGGFSILWIFLLSGLYLLKTRLWASRQETRLQIRRQILQQHAATGIKEIDIERVEWLNLILQQLWPYVSEYAAHFMREFIEPQVQTQMPAPFKSFRFTDIDLGDQPCRIIGTKVYTRNVGRDRIIMDLEVAYAGDAHIKTKVCGFTGGMNELVLSGKVRCIMEPLIARPPMIAAMKASFVELPKFDFNLTGMGDFLQLPLLIDAIRSVVNTQMANLCVLPNSVIIPLAPDVNITKLYVPVPDGIVRIKVVEAASLGNKDVSFIVKDKSDPYVELQVGAQLFRTKTVNNNLNPRFDEFFEAVVDQASAQKLRINVFDQDTTGSDEELGHLSIPLAYVRKQKVISKWFHLESCKHGMIYLKLFWCDLSPTPIPPSLPTPYLKEWQTANHPTHSTLLVVYVDSVKELPYPKADQEPSPFLELGIANAAQRSPVKVRTTNPVYQSKFLFLLQPSHDKELQELTMKAIDNNTSKLLGELSISLDSIMQQPDAEFFDKVFHLRHGVHTSPVTLTLRLRHIIPPAETIDDELAAYGNASYVERARAENSTAKPPNGDAFAVEPAKRPEDDHFHHPESSVQLNPSRFTSIGSHHASDTSSVSSKHTNKSLKSKLLRFRKHHKRDSYKSVGNLEYNLRLDLHENSLILDIICIKGLVPHSSDGHVNPYVSVKLFHDSGDGPVLKAKRRSKVVEHSTNPQYDSRFEFSIQEEELQNYKFLIVAKDRAHGLMLKPTVLGQAELSLTHFSRTDEYRQRVLELHP